LGFGDLRVWGLGFGFEVWGLGDNVAWAGGLGLGSKGSRFRDRGLGFRVWGFWFLVSGFWLQASGSGFRSWG
jgi:hypothetical protein